MPAAPLCPTMLPVPKERGRIMGFIHRHPTIVVGGLLVGLMILIAIFAPYLGTVDPTALAPAQRTRQPSALYWFGTDMLGRDVYSRVMYGSRVSLIVGFSVAFCRLGDRHAHRPDRRLHPRARCGGDAGDGRPDVDPADPAGDRADGADPRFGAERHHRHLLAEFPRVSRLVRGVVLSLREQPYVEAAIASGTRVPVIIWKHILPNTLAPLMVQATFICASAMITEATLSFIGAGTPPIIPSWGNIMAEGRALWQVKPYIVFFPAIFLSITVLAVNLLGDGLRDALDPRLAKRL